MKYIIDEMEFWTEKKENKVCKYSAIVSQCIILFFAATLLAYSIVMFGTN